MQDYEKLGSFYLGRAYDLDAKKAKKIVGSNARLAVRSIAASCRRRSMACHGMPRLSCARPCRSVAS